MIRPRLLIDPGSAGSSDASVRRVSLPRLDDLRLSAATDRRDQLITSLIKTAESQCAEEPWTPATPLPQRDAAEVERKNREYALVGLTASRILDGSLAALLLDRRDLAESVLLQIETIYDRSVWEEIEDQTHLFHGDHCSLRSGQLAFAIGLAYDWLYQLLTSSERARIISGFHDRFTLQFRDALKYRDRWVDFNNNFVTAIFGGFSVAGMAFDGDYSEASWLIDTGSSRIDAYVDGLFGPEGEFDESVQYSSSVSALVSVLLVRRSYENSERCLTGVPLEKYLEWYIHATLPPGRIVGFGDPGVDMPPVLTSAAAGAALYRNPVFQWFYEEYADKALPSHRNLSFETILYDPAVKARSPEGVLPRGRAYREFAGIVTSRNRWIEPDSIVYAKCGCELNHGHADWGQLCIDGSNERLVVDLGSTPGYPRADSHKYYNYQQWGHNVFFVGDPDSGGTPIPSRDLRKTGCGGRLSESRFDETLGSCFRFDLSNAYPSGVEVKRSVVHLFPRVVVVLDSLKNDEEEIPISLRWHLAECPQSDDSGNFFIERNGVHLSGLVAVISGDLEVRAGHHAYCHPYNRNAHGELYSQRNEPYVEAAGTAKRCSILTLFCVGTNAGWAHHSPNWSIETGEGNVEITLTEEDTLSVVKNVNEIAIDW